MESKKRCWWAGDDPLYVRYHDEEWGRPVHDDRRLFEMLILEGAQAGLSWITILRKRENYRRAFCNFEKPAVVVDGPPPFFIMVTDIKRIVARPKASLLDIHAAFH